MQGGHAELLLLSLKSGNKSPMSKVSFHVKHTTGAEGILNTEIGNSGQGRLYKQTLLPH